MHVNISVDGSNHWNVRLSPYMHTVMARWQVIFGKSHSLVDRTRT